MSVERLRVLKVRLRGRAACVCALVSLACAVRPPQMEGSIGRPTMGESEPVCDVEWKDNRRIVLPLSAKSEDCVADPPAIVQVVRGADIVSSKCELVRLASASATLATAAFDAPRSGSWVTVWVKAGCGSDMMKVVLGCRMP